MHIQLKSQTCNYGGGGRPPLPFLKIKKSVLILKRNTLIVPILDLNFPFKI